MGQVGILEVLVSHGTTRVAHNDLRVGGTLFGPLAVLIEEGAQNYGGWKDYYEIGRIWELNLGFGFVILR